MKNKSFKCSIASSMIKSIYFNKNWIQNFSFDLQQNKLFFVKNVAIFHDDQKNVFFKQTKHFSSCPRSVLKILLFELHEYHSRFFLRLLMRWCKGNEIRCCCWFWSRNFQQIKDFKSWRLLIKVYSYVYYTP